MNPALLCCCCLHSSHPSFTVPSHAPPAADMTAGEFPLTICIFATVRTFVGRLQFRDQETGEPQVGVGVGVEAAIALLEVLARGASHAIQCFGSSLKSEVLVASVLPPTRFSTAWR